MSFSKVKSEVLNVPSVFYVVKYSIAIVKYSIVIARLITALVNDEIPPVNLSISELMKPESEEHKDRFGDACWLVAKIFKLATVTQDRQKRDELLLLLNRAENVYLDVALSTIIYEDIDYDRVDKELTKIKEELQEVIKA
jgi:hypothetical protein